MLKTSRVVAQKPRISTSTKLLKAWYHSKSAVRIQRLESSRGGRFHVAFQSDVDQFLSVAAKFPSMFSSVDTSAADEILGHTLTYHTSMWYHCLVENQGKHKLGPGPQKYLDSLGQWTGAYTEQEVKQCEVLVNRESDDIFVFLGSSMRNTGKFLGENATGVSSFCAGAYRLKVDQEGKISDVWLYRSGTAEERKHLLKDDPCRGALNWLPALNLVSGGKVAEGAKYRKVQTMDTWLENIWSKGHLQEIFEIFDQDVQVYDCVGISSTTPLVGAGAYYQHLEDYKTTYNMGPRVALSMAAGEDDNKSFVHWSHCLTHKASGQVSTVNGISMFVFNEEGRVAQLLDFSEPTQEHRDRLFHERHLVPLGPRP